MLHALQSIILMDKNFLSFPHVIQRKALSISNNTLESNAKSIKSGIRADHLDSNVLVLFK